ncbi:MAG TPA: hypothetical protein PKA20_07740 [Burkholderiaceae bacterium]|nr:hypothetical protein [Burkholderiaceae bacterium]
MPVVAWASFKPVRVIAPELLGLTCTQDGICIDDVSRLPEARELKAEAVRFVNDRVGRIESAPRAIFCSGYSCAESFGLSSQVAYSVGTFGLVIGPRGWHRHFVRHELIHHVQNERLGSLKNWFFTPDWFLEGMAYSLSEDPRRPLPEPLEGWRREFEHWYPAVGGERLWFAAGEL